MGAHEAEPARDRIEGGEDRSDVTAESEGEM